MKAIYRVQYTRTIREFTGLMTKQEAERIVKDLKNGIVVLDEAEACNVKEAK